MDPKLERIARFMDGEIPFNSDLGIQALELWRGGCVMRIPIRSEMVGDPDRPALHGGVLSGDGRARLVSL